MIVTLLSDFGAADFFVGAMKGAVLTVCREAQLVDITHEIPAHDVRAGAWTLLAAYESFPHGTVHLAVVDPGVGSERRPLVVRAGAHFFVGPDNGLFSYVMEREEARGRCEAFHVTNREYFRPRVSSTFHGRDLFAPVAGAVAEGVEPSTLGEPIVDYVRLAPLRPARDATGALEASIIHVDRFGNCITNITPSDLSEASPGGVRLIVGGREVSTLRRFFAEGAPGEAFAIWGSAGFLEIAVFRESAARMLGVGRGSVVRVVGGGGS